ncbi:MAG TPA: hypothetical protein VJX31_07250 [Casimicrobiaceae bacterium]|nr:hypothetical protein [Casimicrobiaceae bacterium]
MDKIESRVDSRAFMRSAQAFAALDEMDQHLPRTSRGRTPPPVDKARARQACAAMGALHSIVVTVNVHKRRRTWYVVDPDRALARQYAAAGLELTPGCKVLVDAELMRPVAVLDFEPDVSAQVNDPLPHGFNPYFDLPAG